MRTKNCFQGFLKQMGCTVVLAGICTACRTNFQCHSFTFGNHTGFHRSYMTVFAAAKLDGVFYTKYTVFCRDHTFITFLTTHGSIEWSMFYENRSALAFHQRIYNLCIGCHNSYFGSIFQFIITCKFCCYGSIDLIVYSCICSHIIGHFTGCTGTLSLSIHLCFKAIFVDLVSLFFQNLFCQIHRESISIIQFESIRTTQCILSCCFHILFHIIQDFKTLIDGFIELILFVCQYIQDKVFLLFQFRISVFGTFDYCSTHFCKELSLDTKKTSMTGSTTDQTAKNIASSFICRHNTIRDQEGSRTHMVCNQTNRYIRIMICTVSLSCDFADFISQSTDGIHIKNRIHILYNNGQTFQTHTGIDILLFQSLIMTFSVIFKLGKYVVPNFDITVAVTAYGTVRFAAAILFSSVIVNLGTWTAGTCTVLPEVVFFTKTEDTLSRNTYFFIPDIKCFIIFHIYRWIKTVRIKTYHLCQKLP